MNDLRSPFRSGLLKVLYSTQADPTGVNRYFHLSRGVTGNNHGGEKSSEAIMKTADDTPTRDTLSCIHLGFRDSNPHYLLSMHTMPRNLFMYCFTLSFLPLFLSLLLPSFCPSLPDFFLPSFPPSFLLSFSLF